MHRPQNESTAVPRSRGSRTKMALQTPNALRSDDVSDQPMEDSVQADYSPTSPVQSRAGASEHMIGTPSEESFATDRIPKNLHGRDYFSADISTPTAAKKLRPTSDAQREVDSRPETWTRDRPRSNENSPSTTAPDQKRQRDEDYTLSGLSVLAAILKGVILQKHIRHSGWLKCVIGLD